MTYFHVKRQVLEISAGKFSVWLKDESTKISGDPGAFIIVETSNQNQILA